MQPRRVSDDTFTSFANATLDHMRMVLSQMERLVTQTEDLRSEVRVMQSAHTRGLETLRADMEKRLDVLRVELHGLREEMLHRFDAAGLWFDGVETRLERIEREIGETKSEIVRLESTLLNAQQSALRAHFRLDELGTGPDDTETPTGP